MSTKTVTIAAPAQASTCNGQASQAEGIQVAVMYTQAQDIFGWRKKTLYVLLVLLVSIVVVNMSLLFWIIKILDLTSEGPGKLRIFDRGVHVESGVEFLDTLSATQVLVADRHKSLKLESARNVTFFAKDDYGFVTNYLSLGASGFQSIGNDFSVRNKNREVLLHVDSKEMVVSANNIFVSDSGGLRLEGSLETPLVRGGATKDLRLESPLKKVKVRSEKDLRVGSPAGGIFVTGLKNMNLKSTGGRVIVDSSRLLMKNLKISQPSREKSSREVFQVCMCENGRVFLAPRQGYCQIDETVCKEPVDEKFDSYYFRT